MSFTIYSKGFLPSYVKRLINICRNIGEIFVSKKIPKHQFS